MPDKDDAAMAPEAGAGHGASDASENREIAKRLAGQLSAATPLVMWEDREGDYRNRVEEIAALLRAEKPDVMMIDVTGAELVSKRVVYENLPDRICVLYRAGEIPEPTADFLLDLKMAAVPFTVRQEGLWAEECGIAPELASTLVRHAAFFASKSRRSLLAKAPASLKASVASLERAMAAACFEVAIESEDGERDAARAIAQRLLIERLWPKGTGLKAAQNANLAEAAWALLEEKLGYSVSESATPSAEDFAYAVAGAAAGCGNGDGLHRGEAEQLLQALGSNPRTRGAFEEMMRDVGPGAARDAGFSQMPMTELQLIVGLREADEEILRRCAADLANGTLTLAEMEEIHKARRHGLWAKEFAPHYRLLLAFCRLGRALEEDGKAPSLTASLGELVSDYAARGHRVDWRYREATVAWRDKEVTQFKDLLRGTHEALELAYRRFLESHAAAWQQVAREAEAWPAEGVPAQTRFYADFVEAELPSDVPGKRIGVVISDAFRYEMAAAFRENPPFSARGGETARVVVELEPMVSTIPSYTQLGMAALLPEGGMEIDPGTKLVAKNGERTDGRTYRQAYLDNRVRGGRVFDASELLSQGRADLDGVSVAVVYHNVIDDAGDHSRAEEKALASFGEARADLGELAKMLLRAGCAKVLITADHGFIYQDAEDQVPLVDVEGLNSMKKSEKVGIGQGRRFIVSTEPVEHRELVEWQARRLSLEGNMWIAVPEGIARLRLSGSGLRYVHGGASPQENIVPVLTIRPASRKKEGISVTQVTAFPVGRDTITGAGVVVDVYQAQPCSASVAPAEVKVGLYAENSERSAQLSAEEKFLTLDSTEKDAEARKTRVTLRTVTDIGEHDSAWVCVCVRVGATARYRKVWSHEYAVTRGFGNDFF